MHKQRRKRKEKKLLRWNPFYEYWDVQINGKKHFVRCVVVLFVVAVYSPQCVWFAWSIIWNWEQLQFHPSFLRIQSHIPHPPPLPSSFSSPSHQVVYFLSLVYLFDWSWCVMIIPNESQSPIIKTTTKT
jgi:hypothetical protein